MSVNRLRIARDVFARGSIRNVVRLLSAQCRSRAAIIEALHSSVVISLQDKALSRGGVRTAERRRSEALRAPGVSRSETGSWYASAAGTQTLRAAPNRGEGVGSSASLKAVRVIRISHFAGPQAKKSDFVSTVSHGAIAVKHFRVRRHERA